MSLKSVELQFALHKNDEAGLKQNQLNHKPAEDQTHLAEAATQLTEKQRQVLSKTDQTNHAVMHERNKEKLKPKKKASKKVGLDVSKSQLVDPREHPFKGKHIDFSL